MGKSASHSLGLQEVYPDFTDKFKCIILPSLLNYDEINRLASIPSMDELRAKLIGLLQAPAAQLARVTKAYSEKEAA